MKIKFDIECSPDEARKFLGLPNVAPMQESMMKELEERMQENIRSLSPEEMVKTWFPMVTQNWNDMQKMFWDQMGSMQPGTSKSGSAKS